MRSATREILTGVLSSLILVVAANVTRAQSASPTVASLPNPILYLRGQESFATGGKSFTRYNYGVLNSADYPNSLFAPAPKLPPCGRNANSSRSWLDIFDQRGQRIYGFCALGKSSDLNGIWFALETGVVPPSYVYIELNDRQTNVKYKSNLADTTP
ncbi:MAG: hypothetical protein ABJB97_07160 [Acidobacteriota bacterium]